MSNINHNVHGSYRFANRFCTWCIFCILFFKVLHCLREKDTKESTDEEIKAQAAMDQQLMQYVDSLPFETGTNQPNQPNNQVQSIAKDPTTAAPVSSTAGAPSSLLSAQLTGIPSSNFIQQPQPSFIQYPQPNNHAVTNLLGNILSMNQQKNIFANIMSQPTVLGGSHLQTVQNPSPVLSPFELAGILLRNNRSQTSSCDFSQRSSYSNGISPELLRTGKSDERSIGSAQRMSASSLSGSFYTRRSQNGVASFPTTVKQFLQSGGLSNPIVLTLDNDHQEQKQSSPLENAARFALVFTQMFIGLTHKMDSSLIELDHFYINQQPSDQSAKMPSEWIQLCIDIMPQAKPIVTDQKIGFNVLAIQKLGIIMYSVFCNGALPPPHLFANSEVSSQGESEAGQEGDPERPPKRPRKKEDTIFSRLIEGNIFPTSICRLLSDMMDNGPGGKADSPFESFGDVVHDLQQMVWQPRIFLHSSSLPPFDTQTSLFGQKHHGQTEAIGTLKHILLEMEHSLISGIKSQLSSVEAVYVSGVAGSGKTCLVQAVRKMLLTSRWTIISGKFERGRAYDSQRIVSSMFDKLIVNLVDMKDSDNVSDQAYSQRASRSILDGIGHETLPSLVDFLPSLPLLFQGLETVRVQAEDNQWRLIYSLAKILEAILEHDRCIMICTDE